MYAVRSALSRPTGGLVYSPGPSWLSSALNQGWLTDAGQSAWNLRVTCPRRLSRWLNHRLPRLPLPSGHPQSTPDPLQTVSQHPSAVQAWLFPPPSSMRNSAGAAFDLAEYAAGTDDSPPLLRRSYRADTHPSSSILPARVTRLSHRLADL